MPAKPDTTVPGLEVVTLDDYVRAHWSRLARTALLLTGTPADASDLVQEALSRVTGRWTEIVAAGNPDGYLFTTMVRLNISRWRKLRREVLMSDAPEGLSPAQNMAAERSEWRDFRELLAELPTRQRSVLILRYYLDFDVAEAARVMACSEGTVKSQTSKALSKIRRRLGAAAREGEIDGRA